MKDWVREAAKEIDDLCGRSCESSLEQKIAIIEKHCPFKPDTAYEEVKVYKVLHTRKCERTTHPNSGHPCNCGAFEDFYG